VEPVKVQIYAGMKHKFLRPHEITVGCLLQGRNGNSPVISCSRLNSDYRFSLKDGRIRTYSEGCNVSCWVPVGDGDESPFSLVPESVEVISGILSKEDSLSFILALVEKKEFGESDVNELVARLQERQQENHSAKEGSLAWEK